MSGWKLFICYYMLQPHWVTQGKGNVVKYTKHSAIKKYTQNLIKTPKHIQNIRKKKTNYIFFLLNSIKNAKPYVTNQVYKSKSISCISFALLQPLCLIIRQLNLFIFLPHSRIVYNLH